MQNSMGDRQNQLVSQALGLGLMRWQGEFKGINTTWLRWVTLQGELLPTPQEIAQQEREIAEQAKSQLLQTARNLIQEGMTVE